VTLFTDEELGIESEFPCAYHAPGTWGWPVQDAHELHDYFLGFNSCHLPNPWNDTLLNTKSVSYAGDPNNSQCFGGYADPTKPKNKALEEEEEHCAGLILPSSQAPDCIHKLQRVLNDVLHKMPGYEKHRVNYLSVMHYQDEKAGIGWHKHDEDNGCDTPVLLVSTGAVRDFYLGEKVKGRKPTDGPDKWWRQPMEHGSLIVMPDAMNYTHWHAILRNTPENRKKYNVPNIPYDPRISINTKCLRQPRVFTVQERHPRWAVYVGCKKNQFAASIYANDYEPEKGHYKPIARNEADFRKYAEKRMQEPAFREQAIKDLRGKHLLCWDHGGDWCHARVWLEIVNKKEHGA
jgi:alkylated DNA repair dioxygenase AlkB